MFDEMNYFKFSDLIIEVLICLRCYAGFGVLDNFVCFVYVAVMAKMTKENPFGRVTPNKKRTTKREMLACKMGYLNGLNDEELMKLGGCCSRTLDNWKSSWNTERLRAMQNLRASVLEISITDKEIDEHQDYIKNLRSLKEQYETELPMLSKISNALENILLELENHPDIDKKDYRQISALLRTYADAKNHRSQLQADYQKVANQLNNETGITAYHKAGAGKINEVAKAEGRLEVARKRRDEGLETSTEKRKGGFFDV